jgi:prepilin-type N-terminal cleavage/methylation domain-containing protein
MINMNKMPNIKGFTLVEILFAITIGLLLLSAIYVAVQSGQRSSVAIEAKTAAQQDVRAALELMALEIGMASYNPTYTSNIWTTGCNGATANNTYKGIQFVTGYTLANAITVEMDIRGNATGTDGDGALDDSNEIISYIYDAANQRITRSTNCGSSYEFLGCTDANGDGRCDNNSTLRTVRVINNTLGIPVFQYFDGSGNVTANIPDIRRIDITLAVETNTIDPNTGQRKRMIYSTSVIPRNHAISQ